jgi:hypothetical protein
MKVIIAFAISIKLNAQSNNGGSLQLEAKSFVVWH